MRSIDKQLLDAAKCGDALLCTDLIGYGADAQAVNAWGNRALHLTAFGGHLDACLALLDCGAGADAMNENGYSALHLAAANGFTPICLLLLAHGADIHTPDKSHSRWNSLHWAAVKGYTSTCLALLDHGVDIHALDTNGCSALHIAVSKDHEAASICLFEPDISVSTRASLAKVIWSAVSNSANNDCVRVLKSFIAAQAARTALNELSLVASNQLRPL